MEEQELSKRERKRLNREEGSKEIRREKFVKYGVRLLIVGVFIVAGVLVYPLISKSSPESTPQINLDSAKSELTSKITDSDQVKGARDSKVVLIEYSDFQCPACASFLLPLKQLESELGDKITIVYRHFPLKTIHQNAELAARVAEAAGLQGKFWDMHDTLFIKQDEWKDLENPKDKFAEYAEMLSLDKDKFLGDLESDVVKNKVEGDYMQAMSLGLNGTPTFFLNGSRVYNLTSYEAFRSLIEKAIAENQ